MTYTSERKNNEYNEKLTVIVNKQSSGYFKFKTFNQSYCYEYCSSKYKEKNDFQLMTRMLADVNQFFLQQGIRQEKDFVEKIYLDFFDSKQRKLAI